MTNNHSDSASQGPWIVDTSSDPASVHRYQNFIQHSTEGIWRIELEEPIGMDVPIREQVSHFHRHAYLAECNDAMARMYGYTNSAELIGKKLDHFFPLNEETDAYLSYFVSSGYKAENVESREKDREGNPKFFLNNLVGVVEGDKLVRAWGTQRDITKQKEADEKLRNSEQELRKLYEALEEKVQERTAELAEVNNRLMVQNETFREAEESSRQGSYSFNLTRGTLDYSDNLYRLLGYEPGEFSPSVEEFNKHVHPDDQEYVATEAQRVMETRLPNDWRYRMFRKNGDMIHIRGAGRVISSAHGVLLVGTLQDITEDVLLRKALLQKNTELEQSNSELQQFAHVASHDLKEPLRKVLIYGQLLQDEFGSGLPENAKAYIEKIKKSADRMKLMIDGVLEHSFMDAAESVKEEVSLEEVLREITNDLELAINQKQARIETSNLPVIKGSPMLIYHLFYNLVNNSLKFSRKDLPPVIRISGERTLIGSGEKFTTLQPGQSCHKIIVEDNGIGFEPQYAELIFQTFTRLHSRDRYEGTGLGLALCKKLVEKHEGAIYAEAEEGKGARFTVLLPA